MPPTKLLIIRHAEKPDDGAGGVTEVGAIDKKSLTPIGWERAGALAVLFANPTLRPGLARPDHVYAAAPEQAGGGGSASRRPYETVVPAARALGLAINEAFDKDSFTAMLSDAMRLEGVVLISWEHKALAAALSRDGLGPGVAVSGLLPARWPDDRFDLVWVFDRRADGGFAFSQVAQGLLAGDDLHVL